MSSFVKIIRHLVDTLRKGNSPSLQAIVKQKIYQIREKHTYQKWLKKYGTLDDMTREQMRVRLKSLRIDPLMSIVLPVYDVDEIWLRLCLDSVLRQIYGKWELCVADDYSSRPHVKNVLQEYAARDERIKVVFREENGHISAASNSALEMATGEFTVFLDHDDELAEDALFCMVKELNEFPDADLIYSDEDKIDENGKRFSPAFKPDFSRDLFYSLNLFNHLSVYRTEIVRKIGGFRLGFEGSQDYDLALRFIENIPEKSIRHIPRILYHWRAIEGSVAIAGSEKPYAHERARQAIREHFERTGVEAEVISGVHDLHRVKYPIPKEPPAVSIILMQTQAEAESYVEITDYPNFEIIVVSTKEPEASGLNTAVAKASGDVFCFLNSSLRPLTENWLREIVSFAMTRQIGVVGAKILSCDNSIASAGCILVTNGNVAAAHFGLPGQDDGHLFRARLTGNFSAVSINCMAVRRDIFESFNGFDAENFPDVFYDADLCLRIGERGYRTLYTPYAELIMAESAKVHTSEKSEKIADQYNYFRQRWAAKIERDPFYNPNFSKKDASFSIDI